MRWINRLDAKFGRFAVPNLTLVLIAGQALAFVADYTPKANGGPPILESIQLKPDLVMAGQWWRLVTYVFTPPPMNLIFAFVFWYLFYIMGTTLEANWGKFRYNLYLLLGYLASVAMAFLVYFTAGSFGEVASNMYFEGTVFLAFARLYPEFVVYLMFILPVKVRWLATLTWVVYGITFLFADSWLERGIIVGRGVQLPGVLRPRHRPGHETPPSPDALSIAGPARQADAGTEDGAPVPRLRPVQRRVAADTVSLLLRMRRRLLLLPGPPARPRTCEGGGLRFTSSMHPVTRLLTGHSLRAAGSGGSDARLGWALPTPGDACGIIMRRWSNGLDGDDVMVFQGHIENGVAVFDDPVVLPDGMRVHIEPVAEGSRKTLAERFKNIIGAAGELPEDMARNHDHYLHGTPKQ